MKSELLNLDVVLIANNFNPAIVTKDWLILKAIFVEEPTNFLNTLGLSAFETNDFRFQLNNERLILKAKLPTSNSVDLLQEKIEKFVRLLPETPYTAVGFNVAYRVIESKTGEEIIQTIKRDYCNNPSKIEEIISSKTFRFGFSLIYNIDQVESTIQINPHRLEDNFFININYHQDLVIDPTLNKIGIISNFLKSLKQYYTRAENISNSLFDIKT